MLVVDTLGFGNGQYAVPTLCNEDAITSSAVRNLVHLIQFTSYTLRSSNTSFKWQDLDKRETERQLGPETEGGT